MFDIIKKSGVGLIIAVLIAAPALAAKKKKPVEGAFRFVTMILGGLIFLSLPDGELT